MLLGESAWLECTQWLPRNALQKSLALRGPHTNAHRARSLTRAQSSQGKPRHLVMLVNGLAGSSANWWTVMQRLSDLTDSRIVLPVPSEANSGRSGTVTRIIRQLRLCRSSVPMVS